MFKKILVAVGGDDATLEPARVAGVMAAQCGAPLTIVSVKRPVSEALGEPYYSAAEVDQLEDAEQLLEKARATAVEAGAEQVEVEWIEGHAADRIAHYAKTGGFDLLVMGNRRRGRLQSAILGSVSAAVAAHSRVPVMIVPEPQVGRTASNGKTAAMSSR